MRNKIKSLSLSVFTFVFTLLSTTKADLPVYPPFITPTPDSTPLILLGIGIAGVIFMAITAVIVVLILKSQKKKKK